MDVTQVEDANEDEILEANTELYERTLERIRSRKHGKSVADYMSSRALEKAKWLSIDDRFHEKVDTLRKKWRIEPQLPSHELLDALQLGEWDNALNLIGRFRGSEEPIEASIGNDELIKDIEISLCHPFELDPQHDLGLAVAAICFGLSPENIIQHWDQLQRIAAWDVYLGAEVSIMNVESVLDRQTALIITLTSAIDFMKDRGIDISSLPSPVRRWVKYADDFMSEQGGPESYMGVLDFLSQKELDAGERSPFDEEILIRSGRDTTWEDIKRLKTQFDLFKAQIYGPRPAEPRIWINYQRDVEIWQLIGRNLSLRKAYDQWLKNHPEITETVDEATIGQSLKKIYTYRESRGLTRMA